MLGRCTVCSCELFEEPVKCWFCNQPVCNREDCVSAISNPQLDLTALCCSNCDVGDGQVLWAVLQEHIKELVTK